MRTFAAAVLGAVASAAVMEKNSAFVQYISAHGKNYASLDEYNMRYENFAAIDSQIKHFNSTEKSSSHGHNFLSDFTAEEKSARLGLKGMPLPERATN